MVGIICYTDAQFENFIQSGFLAKIAEHHTVTVFTTNELASKLHNLNSVRVEFLPKINKHAKKVSTLLQLSTLWRLKSRSPAHKVRAYNLIGNNKQQLLWKTKIYGNSAFSLRIKIIIKILSINPFYQMLLAIQFLTRVFLVTSHYGCFKGRVSVLLIPYEGHINEKFGIYVWVAKLLKIKSLALQQNWDNLSTKSFILDCPDIFCVWGEQSVDHVKSIQKLSDTEVNVVGSPRFDIYWEETTELPKVSLPNGSLQILTKPFILLTGVGSGQDNHLVLLVADALNSLLSKHGEIDLVYRPHPNSSRTLLNIQEILDSNRKVLIDTGIRAREFGHREILVKSCMFTINQLSTLTLESLLAGKQTILPLFSSDQDERYGYHRMLTEFVHLTGVSTLKQVKQVAHPSEILSKLSECIENKDTSFSMDNWICKKGSYSKNVLDILDSEIGIHD